MKTIKCWKSGESITRISGYDYIILDESQDLRPSFYEALCFMIPENTVSLIIMGDPKQLLYNYGKDDAATSMYLENASTWFKDHSRTWFCETLSLTKSFRLTPKIAAFVNIIWNVYSEDYIIVKKM